MRTDYYFEEFILAAGFTLTPWQGEIISKLESMKPEERKLVLERPRRTRKRYGDFPTLGD